MVIVEIIYTYNTYVTGKIKKCTIKPRGKSVFNNNNINKLMLIEFDRVTDFPSNRMTTYFHVTFLIMSGRRHGHGVPQQ